jgi:hypothetical protein
MYFTEGSFSKSSDAELAGLLRIMRNMCQVFDDSFYHGGGGMVKKTQAGGACVIDGVDWLQPAGDTPGQPPGFNLQASTSSNLSVRPRKPSRPSRPSRPTQPTHALKLGQSRLPSPPPNKTRYLNLLPFYSL